MSDNRNDEPNHPPPASQAPRTLSAHTNTAGGGGDNGNDNVLASSSALDTGPPPIEDKRQKPSRRPRRQSSADVWERISHPVTREHVREKPTTGPNRRSIAGPGRRSAGMNGPRNRVKENTPKQLRPGPAWSTSTPSHYPAEYSRTDHLAYRSYPPPPSTAPLPMHPNSAPSMHPGNRFNPMMSPPMSSAPQFYPVPRYGPFPGPGPASMTNGYLSPGSGFYPNGYPPTSPYLNYLDPCLDAGPPVSAFSPPKVTIRERPRPTRTEGTPPQFTGEPDQHVNTRSKHNPQTRHADDQLHDRVEVLDSRHRREGRHSSYPRSHSRSGGSPEGVTRLPKENSEIVDGYLEEQEDTRMREIERAARIEANLRAAEENRKAMKMREEQMAKERQEQKQRQLIRDEVRNVLRQYVGRLDNTATLREVLDRTPRSHATRSQPQPPLGVPHYRSQRQPESGIPTTVLHQPLDSVEKPEHESQNIHRGGPQDDGYRDGLRDRNTSDLLSERLNRLDVRLESGPVVSNPLNEDSALETVYGSRDSLRTGRRARPGPRGRDSMSGGGGGHHEIRSSTDKSAGRAPGVLRNGNPANTARSRAPSRASSRRMAHVEEVPDEDTCNTPDHHHYTHQPPPTAGTNLKATSSARQQEEYDVEISAGGLGRLTRKARMYHVKTGQQHARGREVMQSYKEGMPPVPDPPRSGY